MSIQVIDKIKPLGDFPISDAEDIDCGGTRLDAVLNASTDELNKKASKEYVDEQIASIPAPDITKAYVDTNFAKKSEVPTVPTNVSAFTNDAGYLTQHQSLAQYAKKSEIPTVPTNVSAFQNDAGYLSQHQSLENYVQTTDERLTNARPASDVKAWAKADNKPLYTKGEVGLGNVDNTSDINKPISQAQQVALDRKANNSSVEEIGNRLTDVSDNQTILSARMDAIESGTTPEGAEVIGIRTGIDGTEYENAGTAVRTQITEVKAVADNTHKMFEKSFLVSGNSAITGVVAGNKAVITEVGTNKVDYSATATNKQLAVDAQGNLQLSNNAGWGAIARGVILESGHDYVFFTDNGTKVSILRVWYMNPSGVWEKIESADNKDFKVVSIPEHIGDCAIDFWNNSYVSGGAILCAIDSAYYSGEYIPYENSITVDGKTYEINARTELPIEFTTTDNYIAIESNTTIRINVAANKEKVTLGSDVGFENICKLALNKCPVQLDGVATLNDDITLETDYFNLEGTENAVVNGNGHWIMIKNPAIGIGSGTLNKNILTLATASNALKVGDTVSVGGSIRLIANVISIDGKTVKLSNSADYFVEDETVAILPRTNFKISGVKFINCWVRITNANSAEIHDNHFVKGGHLALNGTLATATNNRFDNFADGITAYSLFNSKIDKNTFSSAKQGVRGVYVNAVSISDNVIENLTNPLSSIAIELTSETGYNVGVHTMACNCIIKNNIIHGANIGVRGSAIGGIHLNMGAHHNLIEGNECKYNSIGIYLENGACWNRIANNVCSYQTGYYGVGIELDWDCNNNVITGNTCNYNLGDPVADESSGIEIRSGFASGHVDMHNIVANNNCCGNGKAGLLLAGFGIIVNSNVTQFNGTDEFKEADKETAGIFMRSDVNHAIITSNIITDGYKETGSVGVDVLFENNIIIDIDSMS